ncbi:uncharacterized protein B0T15DRAFT_494732 [Chaetomium strumarium]|uniref:Uncharacterized protein n=1 Tax=Chaetomium strumarium TaxID=1170767 RepID=A0AAJ0GQG0_9PEZI|nr:hypothetical protein B0T15DRAFT_494732 [Chaetomium strumarium]
MAKPTATARLRRTFHYPSDDDAGSASSGPEVLDEQEQETLIQTLTTQNETRNRTFHRLLSALPALSTIPFLLGLFLSHSAGPSRLLSLLGLSSLCATGWMLYTFEVCETGFPRLDRHTSSLADKKKKKEKGLLSLSSNDSRERRRTAGAGLGAGARTVGHYDLLRWNSRPRRRDGLLTGPLPGEGSRTPLQQHLPWLNVGLAALVLLTGLLERVRLGGEAANAGVSPLLLGALPGVVYAVVVGAKVMMAEVDPERELGKLKYGYKGA